MTNNTGTSYTFPRLDTPENKKKEEYHESFARAIINRAVDDSWRNNWLLMAECYKFLEEGSNGELVSHLQKADDNTDLPAIWLSLNKLPTKIDLLIGELETRGYEIRVRAMSKEAAHRKNEEKERLRVKRALQPLFKQADQDAGLPVPDGEYVPQTEQELNEYVDLSFKEKAELIMGGALVWLSRINNWDEERKALFRDILAVGRAWVKNEIVRGRPVSRRVHPLNMIFDTSATRDDLSDATFFGEMEYQPLASAAARFNLTTAELEQVYANYKQFMGVTPATEAVSSGTDYAYGFDTIAGQRVSWFKQVDGELRVLVARAVWRDYSIMRYKDDKNEFYGTEHFQEIPSWEEIRERDKNKIVERKIEIWRQCTIIGGQIIREWGECPNMPRNSDDIGTTEAPYKGWIPNYSSGRGVSKVEQLASAQLYKDVILYNMQLAVLRAGARGISYDLAMLPPTMSVDQVMRYLKVAGISFYNSKDFQYLPGSNTSPFREFDMSLSDSVGKYIEIMRYLDTEMDQISGISPERQGAVQGASQGLGVTRAALFQSNLITQPYFIGFERFCSRVLGHQAKLVKIAWADNEAFAPIIGDVGVDFLKEHFDLELEDFAVIVESVPPLLQDRAKFEQLVMLAVQSDPTFFDEALAILMETDLRVAVRRFQRKRALQKIFAIKQAEVEQQHNAALEERLVEIERSIEAERQQREIAGRLEEVRMKNEGGLQKTLATGRVKLSSDNIKSRTELAKLALQPTNNENER